MQFKHTKLSNGLTIIAELNENAYSASIGFFVRTGSRNESAEILGASHFLEHLVFKGSESLSAIDVNCRLDELGADGNAFTENEQTVFHITLLPEFIGDAIELFGDILRPAFREKDFKMEKQVILEEIRMYCDQPPFGADNIVRKNFFGNHPLANSVLGEESTTSKLSVEQLKSYHAARYSPDNIVVVGTGKIEFDYFCNCVKKVFGKWEISSSKSDIGDRHYRICGASGFHKLTKKSASQQYTMLLSDAPSGVDSDFFAALILTDIIGDSAGSRFYWEFIDNGIAETACMSIHEYSDNGFFGTALVSEPENAQKIINDVKKIFVTIIQEGITQDELERAKNKALTRIVIGSEGSDGRLFTIGGDWLMTGKYKTLKQESDLIRNITIEDIRNVLKKYPLDKSLIMTIGPTK
ncbi:MAG: insulinase family protein [Planctomycetaceae bacterium]|jgi:predicted Zn-dependent peptidase|nr:insulinase family protein [Planctomycetaceae bacterium]